MDNSLRSWIASSLLSGHKVEELRTILVKSGFSSEDIERELEQCGPYVSVITKINSDLILRNGLLKFLDQQLRASPDYLKVNKIRLPPFGQFLEEYFYPNRPGHFTAVLDDSEARHWTPRSLIEKVGADTMINIQHKRDTVVHYEQSSEKLSTHMKFADYIELVENPDTGNRFYMSGSSYNFNREPFALLRNVMESIDNGYFIPDDADRNKIYFLIGPGGTMTSTHYDNTNILFIQVYGRKLIRLIPAMQSPYMYNTHYRRFSDVDIMNPQLELYPEFANTTVIELEVGPGEAVFIPLGWWHHVTSLSPSISVPCGNINAGQDFQIFLP